jgi:hypothetical protein
MKKHKPNFMRDVRFYLANRHRFSFTGSADVTFAFDRNGVDGVTAYKELDSNGKVVATRHPNLATALARTKASVNFHIKLWKDGTSDGGRFVHELAEYLDSIQAPKWVGDALSNTYGNIHIYRKGNT